MFLHRPLTQMLFSGQSLSPLGQLPSGKHPVLYGSPTWPWGHKQLKPVAVGLQVADLWQGSVLHALVVVQATSGRGSGRVPGGHEHLATWFSGRHTALVPHVSAVHTSMHL